MRFVHISEVRDYWEALRAGRDVPYRSEIDPRGIERALEFAFVLERVAPQVARFRLAGMHLSDLMGMEVRGMPLTSFFTPKAREEVSDVLQSVFTGPRTAELTLKAEPGFGKPEMQARLIILPLKSDLGDVSRALGCLMAEGPIGRAPRRFDIVSCAVGQIETSTRSAFRTSRLPAPEGFAEPPAPFAGAMPRGDQKPGASEARRFPGITKKNKAAPERAALPLCVTSTGGRLHACRFLHCTAVLKLFGDEEGQFERLRGVQTRVAGRVIAVRQILIRHRAHPAGAFGDILAGHLEMNAARVSCPRPCERRRIRAPRAAQSSKGRVL